MSAEFHRYPREDLLELRFRVRRLGQLEGRAAEACTSFVERHTTALALSFGKDSMAVLHVMHVAGVLERCAAVMWNASGMDTPDTLAMRDYVVERYHLGNYVETTPDAGTLERTLRMIDIASPHPIREFVYECLELPRWRVMDERGIDGTILGLRAGESRGRAANYAMRGTEYANRRERVDILQPIARWTTRDVLLYSAWRNVPLHPIYHRMAELGFARDNVRHSSPVNLVARERGQLVALKRLYPDIFRRYVSLVPAVRSFA